MYRICDGQWVRWRDPKSAENYEGAPGPFFVVRVAMEIWTPVCTCDGKRGGLLGNGHSRRCEGRFDQVEGLAVTVLMNGRHQTLPEDLIEVVKKE